MQELYFDYAATTPVDERVIRDMVACLGREANFGNPASVSHGFGQTARLAVEAARRQVAELVGAQAASIVWTSGATESSNLAIKGLAALANDRRHVITSRMEHKSVLDTFSKLERDGFEVTWLTPDSDGLIQPEAVAAALREDTLLVSLMLINNELGTTTDVATVGEIVRERGALFHVDAAQATGKVSINLSALKVDLMSFSAHKTYGPKGIGALYVGERARPLMQPLIHGGGHEQGLRSGTLATHQIVGMGSAFALAGEVMEEEGERIAQLSTRILDVLLTMPNIRLNGSAQQRVPHTLNFCIEHPWFDTSTLSKTLAYSSTSACSSGRDEPSHVLMALGMSTVQAYSSIRLSVGRYTTLADVECAIDVIRLCLPK